MKLYFMLLFGLIISAASCEKEQVGVDDLYGNWKLSESYSDPGDGSGTWQKVSSKFVTTVKFDSDGKLSGTSFPDYSTYAIKDSVTLVFSKGDGTLQNYRYEFTGNKLTLSPAGPIFCIEGCGLRFVKEN